jgi:hypothetical protein
MLSYHTHRDGGDETGYPGDFSIRDIGWMKGRPRDAFMMGVGSIKGGSFAFQTEKSARLPLSTLWWYCLGPYFELVKESVKLHFRSAKTNFKENDDFVSTLTDEEVRVEIDKQHRVSKGGKPLDKLGLVCYIWRPPEDFDWQNPNQSITIHKVQQEDNK